MFKGAWAIVQVLWASALFRRFSEWALFSFLVALVPFGICSIVFRVLGLPFSLWDRFEAGELLLVCCALSGPALGEVFTKRRRMLRLPAPQRERYDTAALYCTFFFMAVVAVSALSYAAVVSAVTLHHYNGREFVRYGSEILFLCTSVMAAVSAGFAR